MITKVHCECLFDAPKPIEKQLKIIRSFLGVISIRNEQPMLSARKPEFHCLLNTFQQ